MTRRRAAINAVSGGNGPLTSIPLARAFSIAGRMSFSSSPRPKSVYRGERPKRSKAPCDAFAHNEVLLLLNALAYNAVHTLRVLIEQETGQGWSLMRVRQTILRVAARVLVHGRQVVVVIARTFAGLWSALTKRLMTFRYVGT